MIQENELQFGGILLEERLLSDEIRMIRAMVRKFVEYEVVKTEEEEGSIIKAIPSHKLSHLQKKAKEAGLWALNISNDQGGAEQSIFNRTILMEEASQHRLGLSSPAAGAFGKEIPSFLNGFNNEDLLEAIHRAVESGEGSFVAVFESEHGLTDELETKAIKKGSKWYITGEKKYVENFKDAEFGLVLAKCIIDDKEQGAAVFLINKENYTKINAKDVKLLNSIDTTNLKFDNLELNDECIIGEIGLGNNLIEEWIAEQKILISARSLGVAKKSLELAIEWTSERVTFRKKLKERDAIRTMIANSLLELNAARLMLWNAALKMENSESYLIEVDMAKITCLNTSFNIIDRAIQMLGGMGVAQEVYLERWYREIRIYKNMFDSEEKMQNSIAEYVYEGKGVKN